MEENEPIGIETIENEKQEEKQSGVYVTKKKNTTGNTVLIILVLIFTSPLWIGLVGAAFGIVAGVVATAFGLGVGAIALVFSALVTLVVAIAKMITVPAVGALLIGVTLLLFGLGCLLLAAAYGIAKLFIWLFKEIIHLLNRLFHRGSVTQYE